MRREQVMIDWKKVVSVMVAIFMTLGAPLTVQARNFGDMTTYSQEYKDAVSFVADNGYMVGTAANKFSPAMTMTRAMFVTVLYSMAGKPAVTDKNPFPDVPSNAWYYNAVRWAYGKGLVSGTNTGHFKPDASITRQDASLILYQYASKNGLAVNKRRDLDGYLDQGNVASYAETAVKWAVATQIYPNTGKNTLGPGTAFSRAEMAWMITRFGTNVEYIIFGRDNYSFENKKEVFSDTYYLSTEHEEKLLNYIEKYYGQGDEADGYRTRINGFLAQENKGSCFGMAVTTILDKLGKIDFNGNFAISARNMYEVSLEKGSIAESAINYYAVTQELGVLRDDPKYRTGSLQQKLGYVVEDMEKSAGLALFVYWCVGQKDGHAVVAYDLRDNGDGTYEATTYDNRYPDEAANILIDMNQGSCTVVLPDNSNEMVRGVEVYTDFSAFDRIDIDDEPDLNGYITGGKDETECDRLYIDMTGDFVIANAEGKTLIWRDFSMEGDMDILLGSYKIIRGSEDPTTFVLLVKPSEYYTVTSLTDDTELNVGILSSNGYAQIDGVIDEEVCVDRQNCEVYISDVD